MVWRSCGIIVPWIEPNCEIHEFYFSYPNIPPLAITPGIHITFNDLVLATGWNSLSPQPINDFPPLINADIVLSYLDPLCLKFLTNKIGTKWKHLPPSADDMHKGDNISKTLRLVLTQGKSHLSVKVSSNAGQDQLSLLLEKRTEKSLFGCSCMNSANSRRATCYVQSIFDRSQLHTLASHWRVVWTPVLDMFRTKYLIVNIPKRYKEPVASRVWH